MTQRINSRKDLVKLKRKLHVRDDWHEPDEEGVSATVKGKDFDNAGSGNEKYVVIKQHGKPVGEVNLADLFAYATRRKMKRL